MTLLSHFLLSVHVIRIGAEQTLKTHTDKNQDNVPDEALLVVPSERSIMNGT